MVYGGRYGRFQLGPEPRHCAVRSADSGALTGRKPPAAAPLRLTPETQPPMSPSQSLALVNHEC